MSDSIRLQAASIPLVSKPAWSLTCLSSLLPTMLTMCPLSPLSPLPGNTNQINRNNGNNAMAMWQMGAITYRTHKHFDPHNIPCNINKRRGYFHKSTTIQKDGWSLLDIFYVNIKYFSIYRVQWRTCLLCVLCVIRIMRGNYSWRRWVLSSVGEQAAGCCSFSNVTKTGNNNHYTTYTI